MAKKNYFLALKNNYKRPDLYYSLANIYKRSKDCENATDAYLNVIKRKNSYPWAHYFLGKCYESLKKYDSARMAYRKEAELNADNALASGIAVIEMDININPDNVGTDTYFELGRKYGMLMHVDNMNKSLDAFYKVLLLDYFYPSVHYEIGKIYKRMGSSGFAMPNFKYAISEYKIELANNPSHKNASLELKQANIFMKPLSLSGLNPEKKQPFDHSLYEYSDLESLKQKIDANPAEIVNKKNSHQVKVFKKKILVSAKLLDNPKPAGKESADFLDYWVHNSETKPNYHRFYSHELDVENSTAKIKFLFNGLMIPYLKKEISKGDKVEFYIKLGCYDVEKNQVYLLADEFSKEGKKSAPHQYTEL
ncbi:MAG: tetratricopeptide repeat protein [Deltaproteobacteria bacterium]|nr:tetratricopeptide repeat protein [Deltaproteobacteria bacterium]